MWICSSSLFRMIVQGTARGAPSGIGALLVGSDPNAYATMSRTRSCETFPTAATIRFGAV